MDHDFASEPAGSELPRQRRRGPWLILALLLAMVAGGAAALWGASEAGWVSWRGVRPSITHAVATPKASPPAQHPAPAPPAEMHAAVGGRVADLEQRLARLNYQAAAAEANAARAEGLMIAFAVRRAVERGLPLGFLEAQLQARFADAQPNAVATLIEAAKTPVTREALAEQLDQLAPRLARTPPDQGLWQRIEHELGSLFVVRKASTPSTLPQRRLERARRFLDMARVDAALAEVERMPGRWAAAQWIALARSHVRAQQALDLIETAALVEPRTFAGANQPQNPLPSQAAPGQPRATGASRQAGGA